MKLEARGNEVRLPVFVAARREPSLLDVVYLKKNRERGVAGQTRLFPAPLLHHRPS